MIFIKIYSIIHYLYSITHYLIESLSTSYSRSRMAVTIATFACMVDFSVNQIV